MSQADTIRAAFALGFLVSREGFNGETTFDRLAPDALPSLKEMEQFLADDSDTIASEFHRLREAAVIALLLETSKGDRP